MDKCIKNHKSELTKNLVNLHSNNPKDYSKILNAGSKINSNAIDINNMFEFMKGMNEYEVDDNIESLPDVNTEVDFSDAYNFLNLPISDEEILDAFEKLKTSN